MATRQSKTFEKKFKPIFESPVDREPIPVGAFVPDESRANHLWTLIDPNTDSGTTYWLPGQHYVNRVGFIYTENPWTEADTVDEYRSW